MVMFSLPVIFDELSSLLDELASIAINALPASPFQMIQRTSEITTLLSIVNWIIPFNQFIAILQVWLVAVAGFYAWKVILRFAKAIE